MTWGTPLTFGICLWLLYQQLGPAAFSGIVVMVVLGPCNGLVMKYIFQFTRAIQTNRDKRVKLLGEVTKQSNPNPNPNLNPNLNPTLNPNLNPTWRSSQGLKSSNPWVGSLNSKNP